ncbi:MAG: ADP-ribosylglycohydrolase family protein [Jatrophihabitantaceae bacterium]
MMLTTAQTDRACGVLLATAAGDALGAGYEFGPPLSANTEVAMKGGGTFGWAPGEWTDDTSMAIAIAEVAATGADLGSDDAQDRIVARWCEWVLNANDVGMQTRSVLGSVRHDSDASTAASARHASEALHKRTGHTAGNGSLMRTAPVALAFLDDETGLVAAAAAISALTHFDPEAGEACVLWCLAIRHAVLTGQLDLRDGLRVLAEDRRLVWAARLDVAEAGTPAQFARNGWVVQALQAAWCAITTTAIPVDDPSRRTFRVDHLRLALEAAVRGGRDTDTVAAITGGLLGAAYGASALPASWRLLLHGWPGLHAQDLVELATRIVTGGCPDRFDYSYRGYGGLDALAQHPYDDHLWLGGIGALRTLPAGVDAVVSLCRVGADDCPAAAEHVEVRLIDRDPDEQNVNLDFVLDDTVAVIQALRAEGRTVLVHCVQAHSRTPTIGALYGMRLRAVTADVALADVLAALPQARPNRRFQRALQAAEPAR